MYDDFYEPVSEFDMMVEDFKNSLRASIKEEITQEMNRLREENESLRDIRLNWDKKILELESGIREKEYELSKAIRAAEASAREAKRLRLKEILKEVAPVVWTIEYKQIKKPKCNLCDQYRKRSYITPLGRQAKEDCDCSIIKNKAYVKRATLCRFYSDIRNELRVFYLVSDNNCEAFLIVIP